MNRIVQPRLRTAIRRCHSAFDDGQDGSVQVRAELLGNVAQHLVEVFWDAERPTDALTDANLPSPVPPPPTPASRCTPTSQRWIVDRGGPWFV